MGQPKASDVERPIETTRLALRRPVLTDVPALFSFLGDTVAMRHTHADASMQACRRRIALHEWQRRRHGYAPWTIATRADGRIVGWGGLYQDPFDPGWGVEIGYFFHPSAWGLGYASELVAVCTRLADDELGLPELHAFAHPDNAASRLLLEKAGFAIRNHLPKMERLLYRRGQWADQSPRRA